jgi:ABC-type sugar transport system permease subunit
VETAYDWITVMIFAGLVTRFLQQSAKPTETDDRLRHYLVPSVGCAVANWLGNAGWHLAAIALIIALLAYAFVFLVRKADH